MQITPKVAAEICYHEGLVRQAYKDSVGIWTWSVGLTNATGHRVDRYIGKEQPLNHCMGIFLWALENYAEAVRAEFAGFDLTEAQFAGALSFHWNTGAIRSASWPDMWKRGDMGAAKSSFLSWRKPIEILPRRTAEAALFFDGKWSGDGTMTEYARVTSSGSPDWSSATRIEVAHALAELLSEPRPERPDADAVLREIAELTLDYMEAQQ